MLLSSWALLTMEEKIISVEEKIIWKGLKKKKKKSVFSERMTVKNSTLLFLHYFTLLVRCKLLSVLNYLIKEKN